jgi:hypothetical protein
MPRSSIHEYMKKRISCTVKAVFHDFMNIDEAELIVKKNRDPFLSARRLMS